MSISKLPALPEPTGGPLVHTRRLRAGRLTFSHLTGDRDMYLFCDLDVWHTGPEVVETSVHGSVVHRCVGCGAPMQFRGVVECPHGVAALDTMPLGVPALLSPPRASGIRVEWLAPWIVPWSFDPYAGETCGRAA